MDLVLVIEIGAPEENYLWCEVFDAATRNDDAAMPIWDDTDSPNIEELKASFIATCPYSPSRFGHETLAEVFDNAERV